MKISLVFSSSGFNSDYSKRIINRGVLGAEWRAGRGREKETRSGEREEENRKKEEDHNREERKRTGRKGIKNKKGSQENRREPQIEV